MPGYSTALGKDHPATRACRQDYSDMLASQEQDGLARPPAMVQTVPVLCGFLGLLMEVACAAVTDSRMV
jgi:hypothetical protein